LLRCDEIQGAFFSKAVSAAALVELFESHSNTNYTDQTVR
jgi:EAL domain-containing protein (putative c-di-GMP-specific phosphodiesterase class I)